MTQADLSSGGACCEPSRAGRGRDGAVRCVRAAVRRRRRRCPGGLPLIRDAEIEQLLRDYTQPILRAAGLAQQNIQVVLINDRASTPS